MLDQYSALAQNMWRAGSVAKPITWRP